MFRKYKAIMDKNFLKDKKVFTVHEEDYLNVVEEKGILEKIIEFTDITNINLRKELKRKDEEIIKLKKDFKLLQAISKDVTKRLKEKDEEIEIKQNDLKTLSGICNKQRIQIKDLEKEKELRKEKEEEIERLKDQLFTIKFNSERKLSIKNNVLEEVKKQRDEFEKENQILKDQLQEAEFLNQEEYLWTLKYIYDKDGVVKEYVQNGMIKEDAEELVGMDSDNWNHYSLTKEERPDKDKIIEGLIIRTESSEEVIKELERELEETNKKYKKYYELYNDTQRVGPKDLRA